MNSILVVCEGNICRSPMAQGLLAAALPRMQVRSAGLGALIGMPADKTAVRLMQERGIDIAAHRAVQINRQMCAQSDIVLVMDFEQRKRLETMYPQACGRIYHLGEYGKRDIPDPYRQSDLAFREALSLIEEGSREWLLRIQRL
jgi:protein-tyrosine phosphatase